MQVRLRRKAEEARLQVMDDGIGINPDFLPHVFERFRQSDRFATRIHSGLGLGLAFVQRIIEQHGGAVRAQSGGPGKGATFEVQFPIWEEEEFEYSREAPQCLIRNRLSG